MPTLLSHTYDNNPICPSYLWYFLNLLVKVHWSKDACDADWASHSTSFALATLECFRGKLLIQADNSIT